MKGTSSKLVLNVEDENSCAAAVAMKFANASGATWSVNGRCWAELGDGILDVGDLEFGDSKYHRSCLFGGTLYIITYSIN